MKKLVLKNDWIGDHPIIRIEFPYDFELKQLVKQFPGSNWDTGKKVTFYQTKQRKKRQSGSYF